jgi:protein SCO1/2
MKRAIALALLWIIVATALHGAQGVSVAPEFPVGETVPAFDFTDDSGRVRSSLEWRGIPTILAPMYTRCPAACPLIVEGLKKGISESSAPPSSYRVVVFSFDPRDMPVDLRRFRERHELSLAWTVATARPADARRLLESIGYRVGDANGLIDHPNAVVVLSGDLKTSKYLFGTAYPGREIDAALAVARGGRDWLGQFGGWMLALLLLASVLSAVYLVTLLGIRRVKLGSHLET